MKAACNKINGRVGLSGRSCFICAMVLVVFGVAYRTTAHKLRAVSATPVVLPVPLKNIPMVINGWAGSDVALSKSVLRTAANDDYINRVYVNQNANLWTNVYIAYSARPRTMLGHRPDVCYVGAGWVRDSTEKSTFKMAAAGKMPCLVHHFHKPDGSGDELVVLNFYVVNGVVSADERLFSGVQWRTPNIEGNAARYVAQIQISAVLENTARQAAGELTQTVIKYLPDRNGKVKIE